MKTNTLLTSILFIFLLGCKKDQVEEIPICGCDSEKDELVENIEASIFFKNEKFVSDYMVNKYWLYTTDGFFSTSYIVCNPQFLGEDFHDILDNNPDEYLEINVVFSGYTKQPCQYPNSLPTMFYSLIELESIERR
ncbi:MAG: hypothetical protein HWE07_07235 [Cytophagia bacterium]|nr:hypothetical protein [Cytophagia bacterium]